MNASEVINGAGGEVTDDNGKPNVDTPEAAKGLDFLVNGFKQGYIPKEAITYKEEEGRASFQAGKLIFHRQWPYVYNLANGDEGTKVKGKFAVSPLPGLDGPGASSLGGHNFGISTYSKHKKSALDFIKFMTSEDRQKKNLELASQAPTIASLYDDKALLEKYPYLPTLRDSINNAVPRPKVVRVRRRLHGRPGRRLRGNDRHQEHGRRPQGTPDAAGGHHQAVVVRHQLG